MQIVPYPLDPRYGVTRDGRVFRIAPWGWDSKPVPFELTQFPDKDGYLLAGGYVRKVHRMVAETFIPNPEGHRQVAHHDGDKTNNNEWNLRWKSAGKNNDDKVRHGTEMFGTANHAAKLTEAQVREIRQRAARGESIRSITRSMPVARPNVKRVISRRTWDHVA